MTSILKYIYFRTRSISANFAYLLLSALKLEQDVVTINSRKLLRITHNSISLSFLTPNKLCRYRALSFSSKEPDTLKWIDSFVQDTVFWDIGANVGLYSAYAALKCNCRVIAFEPSILNLELLARNLHLNGLEHAVTIVPIALYDQSGVNTFTLSTNQHGGALSTFAESYDQNGHDIHAELQYQIPGLSMTEAMHYFKLPLPSYIKIDVDGIEHLVIKGDLEIFSQVRSVLVELNDSFYQQSYHSTRYLTQAGLKLQSKRNMIHGQHNQLWVRS